MVDVSGQRKPVMPDYTGDTHDTLVVLRAHIRHLPLTCLYFRVADEQAFIVLLTARCQVSPRWLESADRDTKLEKIITQKWIAMFPEGCEAWAEQRRTGYPRLFPVRFNHSKDGCIDTETMIRRLNFPGGLKTENAEQYAALVEALGGDDNAGTRLWWDTGINW